MMSISLQNSLAEREGGSPVTKSRLLMVCSHYNIDKTASVASYIVAKSPLKCCSSAC